MKQQLPGVDAKLQKITEDKRREEKRSISARVFHSISFSAILSSSSSTVSLVRQSSPPHHASDDAATCFHRRRARRCLNAWSSDLKLAIALQQQDITTFQIYSKFSDGFKIKECRTVY
ncbi:uncharacterized protein LOC127741061 [Arachis duranensis]|uniref:Uncharacterized protein LOC127741061 n=1 Tax=Arachis duranensis TaxID=130453 RepID=A0A9C6WKX1_ARADU|nr:uncharacterized protein LOC127741061 [Arachis duranensis]XP_052108381.1 uncharacterized protein LOC127741061 [Arachis duranensis]